MTLQNRVTPLGELVDAPARGLLYGNRGCLHDDDGVIRRRWAGRRWIGCQLEFKGRRRPRLLQPGRYTELFFLDEATAFAAGHRPCAECRRPDYDRFGSLWRALHPGDAGADAIDLRLHGERVEAAARTQRLHAAAIEELPDGAFVLVDGQPRLVLGRELLDWSPFGYTARHRRPAGGEATLITPPSLVAILRAGWRPLVPLLHPTAG